MQVKDCEFYDPKYGCTDCADFKTCSFRKEARGVRNRREKSRPTDTPEILALIEERSKYPSRSDEYRRINQRIIYMRNPEKYKKIHGDYMKKRRAKLAGLED